MIVDFLNSRKEELFKQINQDSRIIIWGAGQLTPLAINLLDNTDNVSVVDINPCKQNNMVFSDKVYEVKGPDRIKWDEYNENDILIICTLYRAQVCESLETLKFMGKVFWVYALDNPYLYSSKDNELFKQKLDWLKSIMCDDESIRTLDGIYNNRISDEPYYGNVMSKEKQYWCGILPVRDNAIYIDGGVFDGADIDSFLKYQNGNFDKIIGFEMCDENYKNSVLKYQDDRIEVLNCGLWNEKKQFRYNNVNSASVIDDNGEFEAKFDAIDNVIEPGTKITLIKMDIEGSEVAALNGAKRTITECKPDLAICLYHNANDIWEIPELIHSMCPGYKYYVRHYMEDYTETVLYAVYNE